MFKRRNVEDFAEEIRSHLELETDELEREGLSQDEAHRKARIQFGNVRVAEERFHLRDRVEWIDNFVRDLKFAIRQMGKNSAFAVTAIIVLALGIGASAAIFAFVDAALLQPLPYRSPDRLMSVNESSPESPRWPLSYPDYVDWHQINHSFSSLDVYKPKGYLLRTGSVQEPVRAEEVSGTFFQTLGVQPILGRDFHPDEDRPGGPNIVLLTYSTWRNRFGARRDIVGQSIELSGKGYLVIGVLPRSFVFAPAGNAELWVPINGLTRHETFRNFYNFWGVGRLRDGVAVQTASADLKAITKRLQQQYGNGGSDLGASVVPLTEVIVGDIRPILLSLLAGASLLLLIACVNVASLVLVRSESRRREFGVRGALGATGARLIQQLVTEGLLLAVLASVAGIAVAGGLIHLLARMIPKDMASNMPFLEGAGLNTHTTIFLAGVSLLAALLMTVTPAIRLASRDTREKLHDGDRGIANLLWRRIGANLAVAELAIAVVLLVGAGLLGQSLFRLLHVSLGFDPDRLATFYVKLPGDVYQTDQQMAGFYRQLVQRISSLPGVESVAMTSMLPVRCNCSTDRIMFPGRADNGERNEVDERRVSPDYFAALHASLIRGRFFSDHDDTSAPGVAIINQALAHRYFPDQDPIGQTISDEERGRPSVWEIIGVVDDVREGPLDGAISPAEYFPLNQTPDHSFNLVVRARQDTGALLPVVVGALHEINSDLGVSDEATMNEIIDGTQAALLHRFSAWLAGGFAVIALWLGVVGLYGVIAYSVSQRTREIGVRMALGAQRSSVYRLVMGQAGFLTIVGLAIGLSCSVGSAMLIRKLLFGVQAWDAWTLISVAALLAMASLAASFLPARRAASVNPTEALRAE
jgi:macrolide transport system ATP-binding/permease protein